MTQHLNMYDILEKLRSVSSNSEAAAAAVQQVTALNAVQTPKDRIDEKYMGWFWDNDIPWQFCVRSILNTEQIKKGN